MPPAPSLVLASWIVITVVLFARLDGRRAALIALIGGWALLPNLAYPEEVILQGQEHSGPIHAVGIPIAPWLNKATAIGLGSLFGIVLFDWRAIRRLRPRWFDLPALLWIALPVLSAPANGLPIDDGLRMARHLALAWGVPYLIGRAHLAEPEGLRQFARAWVLVGLATSALGIPEFLSGPFWYHLLYGGHPYNYDGADRWIGHRPLGWLEHGNQFGMWSATAALAATWLWATGQEPIEGLKRRGVPGPAVPVILVASCLAWQSHGSIGLLLLGLLPLPFRPRPGPTGSTGPRPWAKAALVAVVVAGVLGGGAAAVRLAEGGGDLRGKVRSVFVEFGKTSFTWRLARAEDQLERIAERPVLGWGRANWSAAEPDGTFLIPIAQSFWVLIAGMFGLVGVGVAVALLGMPIVGSLLRLGPGRWGVPPLASVTTASAMLAINAADLFLNSGFLLPMMLAVGGVTGWAFDRSRSPRPGAVRG